MKDPISRHVKLDDRWIGPVTWIGAVELYKSIRRIPLSQRWKAEAMTRLLATEDH